MRSLLKRWEQLPQELQNDSVRPYYEALSRKRGQLLLKRVFDILLSLVLLVLLSPVMLILALAIRLDSPGEVTQYGQEFRIFKFRTMVANAQQLGTQVTVQGDMRITRVGKLLRKCRLDELPQLLNILMGQMSFVGTRPEVPRYVRQYTPQMLATLLLPAGVTSQASIRYKDEDRLLDSSADPDRTYVEQVLPGKMERCCTRRTMIKKESDTDECLDNQPLCYSAVDGRAGAALLFFKISAADGTHSPHLYRQRDSQHQHQYDS